MNKFPFDVAKKAYPFWDGAIGRAVDIEYDGTEELFGLDTYRFTYTVTDEAIEVAEGVDGTYDNTVTVNVDPRRVPSSGPARTSSASWRRHAGAGHPGIGTDDTVKDSVDEAKANGSR